MLYPHLFRLFRLSSIVSSRFNHSLKTLLIQKCIISPEQVAQLDIKYYTVTYLFIPPQSWCVWHPWLLLLRELPQSASAFHHHQTACTTWPAVFSLLGSGWEWSGSTLWGGGRKKKKKTFVINQKSQLRKVSEMPNILKKLFFTFINYFI